MTKKKILVFLSTTLNKMNKNQYLNSLDFLSHDFFKNFDLYYHSYNTLYKPNFMNILDFKHQHLFNSIEEFDNQFNIYDNMYFDYVINLSLPLTIQPKIEKFVKDLDKIEKKFVMTSTLRSNCYFIKLLKNNKIKYGKHYHIVIDPVEKNISDIIRNSKRLYFYKSNNLHYFPFIDFYSRKYISKCLLKIKTKDFIFGCSIVTEDRRYLEPLLEDLSKSFDIFCKNKYLNIKTEINHKEYIAQLNESKYTLIAPSYDKNHFSMIRFIEAVENNCIPLVLNNCNINVIKETYNGIFNIIVQYLLVEDASEIKNKINTIEYNIILKLLKYELKKYKQESHFEEYFNKFFGQLDLPAGVH